ncbi:PREDICTED: uncharacterized protein LOC104820462 [Tarenaya hassleriana]|uniref:uncharacterized protein LOC104820462 n=1 Tax=Tarenaya hassleriana TaxID=28532 RepID=UPI00053C5C90|nr:PREDICTED: uncharacterized protein LOC104820462 [Tarenaya hassleriana]
MVNSGTGSVPTLSPSLRSIIEREKLNGANFLDWCCYLRIVLRSEDKEYVLHEPFVDEEPPNNAPWVVNDAYLKYKKDNRDVSCLMLGIMTPDLIKQFDGLDAWMIMDQLKLMFEEKARSERFKVMCSLLDYKLANGCPIGPHVLKMKSHFDDLERLGAKMHKELAEDMVLHSLPDSF